MVRLTVELPMMQIIGRGAVCQFSCCSLILRRISPLIFRDFWGKWLQLPLTEFLQRQKRAVKRMKRSYHLCWKDEKRRFHSMEHHRLDPYPIPKDKTPLYINEPWLIDKSLLEHLQHREPEEQPDNVRIYLPMDLNQEAILRRLDRVLPI